MLAFIHIPKCGGTTMRALLYGVYGVRHIMAPRFTGSPPGPSGNGVVTADEIDTIQRLCPWVRCVSGHNVVLWAEWPGTHRYFTLLRHPVDRVISHYQYLCSDFGLTESIDEWLPKSANLQCRYLAKSGTASDAVWNMAARGCGAVLLERLGSSIHANGARLRDIEGRCKNDASLIDRIKAVNNEDMKLYEVAVKTIVPLPLRLEQYSGIRCRIAKNVNRFCLPHLAGAAKRGVV